jgi:hypothetical protein
MKLTTIAKQILGRQTPNAINEGRVLKGMVDGKPTYIIEHDGQELRVSEKDWKAFKDMISLKESVVTEAKNTIGLAFKEEQDYLDFKEFVAEQPRGAIKKDFGWDSKTKSWEVIMDVKVLDDIYGEGTPANRESGWYGALPDDFESVIIESTVNEGTMSDIHMLAQEASTIEDFIKGFMADYGDKFVGASKPKLDKWLADLYADTKS